MFQRMIGVLKLDVNTFEEIEHDQSATSQAAIIVAVVALLTAIGSFMGAGASNVALQTMLEQFGQDFSLEGVPTISPIWAALNGFIGTFFSWLIWSVLTYLIGTTMFQGKATIGEMLRVLGYAQTPRLLNLLSGIPCLGVIIALIAAVWTLVAGFIAIRQGLDLDNTKTAITVVISFLVTVAINFCVLGPIFGVIGGILG